MSVEGDVFSVVSRSDQSRLRHRERGNVSCVDATRSGIASMLESADSCIAVSIFDDVEVWVARPPDEEEVRSRKLRPDGRFRKRKGRNVHKPCLNNFQFFAVRHGPEFEAARVLTPCQPL